MSPAAPATLITLSERQKKIRISATADHNVRRIIVQIYRGYLFPLRLQCLIADFSKVACRSKKSRGAQTQVEGRRGLSMPYNGSLRLIIFIVRHVELAAHRVYIERD